MDIRKSFGLVLGWVFCSIHVHSAFLSGQFSAMAGVICSHRSGKLKQDVCIYISPLLQSASCKCHQISWEQFGITANLQNNTFHYTHSCNLTRLLFHFSRFYQFTNSQFSWHAILASFPRLAQEVCFCCRQQHCIWEFYFSMMYNRFGGCIPEVTQLHPEDTFVLSHWWTWSFSGRYRRQIVYEKQIGLPTSQWGLKISFNCN